VLALLSDIFHLLQIRNKTCHRLDDFSYGRGIADLWLTKWQLFAESVGLQEKSHQINEWRVALLEYQNIGIKLYINLFAHKMFYIEL